MTDYGKVPASAKVQPKPFRAHVDEQKLKDFKELLRLSPIGVATFENTSNERRFGMERDWLINAKKVWQNDFDWRKWEDRINSYPNFTMAVKDNRGVEVDVHFLALFSEKPDAIPIAFYHGWPGSFLEFLQILDIAKKQYSPADLPFHIIVPSLPGYTYSSGPPLDVNYTTKEAAQCLDQLMVNLGFGSGYLAQGGDVGSGICRWQANTCDSCKAVHLNMFNIQPPANADQLPVDDFEKAVLERKNNFVATGSAYNQEHGTRTATIGLVLSSSPIALLSWYEQTFDIFEQSL